MSTFKYSVLSKDGQKVNGVITAYDQLAAASQIKQNYDIILKLEEVKEKKETILDIDIGSNRLNMKAFTMMCSQFSIILESGVSLSRCVKLIADKMTNKPLKKILNSVAEDVEGGRTLANALQEKGSKLLPITFIETIRAGEESGNLTQSFKAMEEHYTKQYQTMGKIKGALIYPAFILVIAVVVVSVLMIYVVPTFLEVFKSYDAQMPAITMSLIYVSNFFSKYWPAMLSVILVILISIKIYGMTANGKTNIAKNIVDFPMIGPIVQLQIASQFANTLGTLLSSGLSITKGVAITSKVISNYYASCQVATTVAKIEEGKTVADAMSEIGVLPDILLDMIAVGEESGELEHTLSTIARYYDEELSQAIKSAVSKLEPTILIIVAIIAGYIVLAVYIAMFSMYGAM